MTTYSPTTHWRRRGQIYERDFPDGPVYAAQEIELLSILHRLHFGSVLDVGCGFGRIGRLVVDVFPDVPYTGVDVSAVMLSSARQRIPTGQFVESSLLKYDGPGADLVLAVEVLMHQPPEVIVAFVEKLRSLAARQVITVDWTEAGEGMRGNFLHDYATLGLVPLAVVGRQTIYGMQV
jgi:trans-aconitate methyltransferase